MNSGRTIAPVAAALAVVSTAIMVVFSDDILLSLVFGLLVVICTTFLYMKIMASREPSPRKTDAAASVDAVADAVSKVAAGLSPDLSALPEDVAAALSDLADRLQSLSDDVTDLSPRDELTSLAKEEVFNNVLWREFNRAERYDEPLSLALIRISGLDALRSEGGRQAADAALKEVASSVLQMIRETDLAARYGDDLMAVVMPGTDGKGAQEFAERCWRALDRQDAQPLPQGVAVAVGVASVPDDNIKTSPDLVKKAVQALSSK